MAEPERGGDHDHVFLGEAHEANERRTWMVIALCAAMMAAEVVGGLAFGSIALIADGLHMSTHASALLLAALAYRYARRHVHDERFSFGTGKLGDLAGFTSAVVLAMIAILIGYEAVIHLLWPVPTRFGEALPIAALGLAVNVASVLLLTGGGHGHRHAHSHDHDRDETHATKSAAPEHHDGAAQRDNNMRAVVFHVLADAAVSLLVIAGLALGWSLGWAFMDPVAGLIGTVVIAAWSYTLVRDTGAVLLDMNPDRGLSERLRALIETDGDCLTDLHVWRLGPGHLAAILTVVTRQSREPDYYRSLLHRLGPLSHLTVQVQHG